jgi:excisionase family DNA binding protein
LIPYLKKKAKEKRTMIQELGTMTTRRNAYLTIPEAAELLRVSQRTLYRWMREGRLKCFRIGNITRIAVRDMENFICNHTESGADDEQYANDGVEA